MALRTRPNSWAGVCCASLSNTLAGPALGTPCPRAVWYPPSFPPCLPLCLGSPDPAAHSCRPLRVRACPARALPSWHFPAVLHLCLSHLPAPMDGKHRGHGLLGGSPESSPVLGSATSQLCDLRKVINLSDYHLCKMGRQICLPQRYTGELNKNNSKLRAFRSTPGCKYVLTPCSCLGRLG